MEEMLNKQFDEYRIVDVLGKGGMGIVYKAFDENLRKYVALKMMNPVLARDDKFMRRFDKEAQSQAQLDHRNIVRVYTFRKTGDVGFIVMELIQGRTLANMMLLKQPVPWEKALPIFKQSLEAISHAHGQNVVHRDIKPGNIMLTDNNQVKVTDFGLAKIQSSAHTTVSETTAGTLRYMSPEQVRGDRNLDNRSDLYSLGITFYEMLTGDLPIGKGTNDYQVYKEILEKELPSPLELNKDVPETLAKVILKATRKDPEERYQSAQAMLDDFLAFELLERANTRDTVLLSSDRSAKTEMAPAAGSKMPLVAGIGALLVALVGFLWWSNSGGSAVETVSLSSSPSSAEVYFDDKFVGNTPLLDYPAKAVVGTISLKKEGYEPLDTLIRSTADLPEKLAFRLRPEITETAEAIPARAGNLDLVSHPKGAEVFLDGESKGVTPLQLGGVPVGEYDVELALEGYENRQLTIQLRDGQTRSLDVTLNEAVEEKPVLKAAAKPPAANETNSRDMRLADVARQKLTAARAAALDAGGGKLTDFKNAEGNLERGKTAYRRERFPEAARNFRSALRLYNAAESEANRIAARSKATTPPPSNVPKDDPRKNDAIAAKQKLEQVSGAMDGGSYRFVAVYKDATKYQSEGEGLLNTGKYDDAIAKFKLAEESYRVALNMRKSQETSVRNVVESYRMALENKDMDGLKYLHPSLKSKDEKNWADFFGYVRNLKVTSQTKGVTFVENGAKVSARIRFDYDGAKNVSWNDWEFTLGESNSSWKVKEISR
ncbi:MAG: protein kinase domain-containing protein [Calditrichia bacterium]